MRCALVGLCYALFLAAAGKGAQASSTRGESIPTGSNFDARTETAESGIARDWAFHRMDFSNGNGLHTTLAKQNGFPAVTWDKILPYHGYDHFENFRRAVWKFIGFSLEKDPAYFNGVGGGELIKQVANVYGALHDVGNLRAITANSYPLVFPFQESFGDNGNTMRGYKMLAPRPGGLAYDPMRPRSVKANKFSQNHEEWSMLMAQQLVADELRKGSHARVFCPDTVIFGMAMISATIFAPAVTDEMKYDLMSRSLQRHLLKDYARLPWDNSCPGLTGKRSWADWLSVYPLDALRPVYAAGSYGDFGYFDEPGALCVSLNLLAEFKAYGGTSKNIPPGPFDPQGIQDDPNSIWGNSYEQTKYFLSKQTGFMNYVGDGFKFSLQIINLPDKTVAEQNKKDIASVVEDFMHRGRRGAAYWNKRPLQHNLQSLPTVKRLCRWVPDYHFIPV